MTEPEQALIKEFVRLRHGWGLAATNLRERIGPHLADLCGVLPADNDRAIRSKITATLKRLASGFALEDQLAADYALGVSAGTQHRLLSDRITLLADRLSCAERTARRRVERAFERLAEEGVAERANTGRADETDPEKGWYVSRFESLLRLDTPVPEVTETRTIVAMRADLKRIAIRFTLPPRVEGDGTTRELFADIAYGAIIESRERQGESHFRFVLELPRALAQGEVHTYSVVYRLPAGQPMRPHYALVPLVPIDSFHVRVRFDPQRPPKAVWRLDHLAPRLLSDRPTPGAPLPLDDAYEVVQEFFGIERGFGYGLAWTPSD